MNFSIRNGINSIRSCVTVLGVFLIISNVSAEGETQDIQAYLPLFERNSLGRKVLDVSYSVTHDMNFRGKSSSGKRDVRLVFDAETRKYREEMKVYNSPNDVNVYRLYVNTWDGKEFVSLDRPVSQNPGSRALGPGVYEYPGHAVIQSQPYGRIPSFVGFYYDTASHPFAKSVPVQNPQLGDIKEDTITIETSLNQFEFSKKNGALKRVTYYWSSKNNERKVRKTYECSDHMDFSGIWMPLRIIVTERDFVDGRVTYKGKVSVDHKTLHLIDKVDDSLFNEPLLAGCGVNDRIRKKVYAVTMVDTLSNDVEAVKKALEEMLEQAEEQKNALEKK